MDISTNQAYLKARLKFLAKAKSHMNRSFLVTSNVARASQSNTHAVVINIPHNIYVMGNYFKTDLIQETKKEKW